jgi:hypothetical protein
MIVIQRKVPMTYNQLVELAGVLHAMTVEEVVAFVNEMPPDAEEWTKSFSSDYIVTLRR